MAFGMVYLHSPALADSERFGAAAAQHHRAIFQYGCKTSVVDIRHLHGMPGSVFIVFRGGRGDESVRVPTEYGKFVVK